jgi:hypothetical protein
LICNSSTPNKLISKCDTCQVAIGYDGWLCDTCVNEREAKRPNKYGLIRKEGIEYFCDCAASGQDSKGNKWVIPARWKHSKECSYFGAQLTYNEKICECLDGSTIKPDGTLVVSWDHVSDCPVLKKLRKDSQIAGITANYSTERVMV